HLAYTHYARPDLRPRVDTDVLISADARAQVDALLDRLGYERAANVTGELVSAQTFHVKRRGDAIVHAVDVHWQVATPLVSANVRTSAELLARSVPLGQLGPSACAPADVHALLIACVHRVAHHTESVVRLKWLYDIDLIARGLDARAWDELVTLAA